MAVYPLHVEGLDGSLLYPQSSSYSEDLARKICSWYLTDQFYRDAGGKPRKGYRLHSNQPRSFNEYMGYDILCPKCHGRLRPIGSALSDQDLPLYNCKKCGNH